jgi:hypothetical protein
MEQEQIENQESDATVATETPSPVVTKFTRDDTVVGVGFFLAHGGITVASIAWPDRPCERMRLDELERHNITFASCAGCVAVLPIVKTEDPQAPQKTEAELIREFLAKNPDATNKDVIAALAEAGVEVTSAQVTAAKRAS